MKQLGFLSKRTKPDPVYTPGYEPKLNLLKPDILGRFELGERRASVLRLGLLCAALCVWVLVGIKMIEVGVIIQERLPDQLEIARLTRQVEAVEGDLRAYPKAIREAREGVSRRVDWAARMEEIRAAAPEGSVFGPYSVNKDGAMQVSGVVRQPSSYGELLDSLSKMRFVVGVKSASLTAGETGYTFSISLTLRQDNEKD